MKNLLMISLLIGATAVTACSTDVDDGIEQGDQQSDDSTVVDVDTDTVDPQRVCPQGCGKPKPGKPPPNPCGPRGCDGS